MESLAELVDRSEHEAIAHEVPDGVTRRTETPLLLADHVREVDLDVAHPLPRPGDASPRKPGADLNDPVGTGFVQRAVDETVPQLEVLRHRGNAGRHGRDPLAREAEAPEEPPALVGREELGVGQPEAVPHVRGVVSRRADACVARVLHGLRPWSGGLDARGIVRETEALHHRQVRVPELVHQRPGEDGFHCPLVPARKNCGARCFSSLKSATRSSRHTSGTSSLCIAHCSASPDRVPGRRT
jgi:hypothetical protein